MLVNGRPYSNENGYIDDKLITNRSEEVIEKVYDWIKKGFIKRKTPNYDCKTSYGLKHILEHDTGIYLSNNEFKDAMLMCGFVPADPDELNWRYCISQNSPVLKD